MRRGADEFDRGLLHVLGTFYRTGTRRSSGSVYRRLGSVGRPGVVRDNSEKCNLDFGYICSQSRFYRSSQLDLKQLLARGTPHHSNRRSPERSTRCPSRRRRSLAGGYGGDLEEL